MVTCVCFVLPESKFISQLKGYNSITYLTAQVMHLYLLSHSSSVATLRTILQLKVYNSKNDLTAQGMHIWEKSQRTRYATL